MNQIPNEYRETITGFGFCGCVIAKIMHPILKGLKCKICGSNS